TNGDKPDFNGELPQMPADGDAPQFPQNGEIPQMPENGDAPQFPQNGEIPQMPENGEAPQFPQGDFNKVNGKNGMNGGTGGVNLVYKDDDISSYNNIFDNNITKVDDDDKKRLIKSLKGISEGENIEEFINVDEVLRYLACNVFLTNLDSYLGSNCHNYILTEDNGKLAMLPWDYNLSFGTYQCSSSSDAINYAIDTVFSGVSAEDRPLIGKLLEKQEYVELYHSYLKQICEEYVQSGLFEKTINNAVSLIGDYVKNDSTSFCTYDEFEKGVEALKLFGKLRAESVLGQLDGSIPSTSEAQKNSSALIDASALDLNALGGMNMNKDFPNKGGMDMPSINAPKTPDN
ncbi:MAG: CotH kinase family protein, partial [Oscillospiraceae bacterium]